MDVYIFHLSAKQLKSIDSRLVGFLVASGHCCNELASLLPFVVFEQSLAGANEVEAAFIVARRFTVARILISKIVEYDKLWQQFRKAAAAETPLLGDDVISGYEPIAGKIKSAKWAHILRNKTSFHYDQQHALDALARLEDDHPLRLIAGTMKGLTLFELSEEIVSRPIFELAGNGDIQKGMDVANEFIVQLVSQVTSFHAKAVIDAFRRSGVVTAREAKELRESYCGIPGEHRVPISISSSYAIAHRKKKA